MTIRSCSWCHQPIPTGARSDAETCSTSCRQARWRFTRGVGPAPEGVAGGRVLRLAYADPPYPGLARKYYGDHPDFAGEKTPRKLIAASPIPPTCAPSEPGAGEPMLGLLALLGAILAANWLTLTYGLVTINGLTATAGTFAAGLVFVARDWLHDSGGRRWVLAAILAGALLSALLSPVLALASAVAFAVSEVADWAVYAPLRGRSWAGAALASNTVGALIDSALFLWLAGFPLGGFTGQAAIKVAGTATVVLAAMGVRRALLRQPDRAGGVRHA